MPKKAQVVEEPVPAQEDDEEAPEAPSGPVIEPPVIEPAKEE